ncbi:hypothetical protein RM530_10445 [Algiphilus sp. W345]|uniref:Histidine kinase n=1 Tax=Banduia mediterranea TaxID=3075609 RepID=A0ABU2WIU6_9GAMM|nr:hypothetical protein [Algiphilus sp. W345]MDT0497780.1 hypothetical protein [Algiphilus sp. W345]
MNASLDRLLPPSRVLWTAALFSILVIALCLSLATRQPWFGLRLAPEMPDAAPRIEALNDRGIDITPGEHLQALSLPGAEALPLYGSDLTQEPDVPFADYASFNRFLERQERFAALLRAPSVELHLQDGRRISMQTQDHRPITTLPFTFWLQLSCAIGSWMVGAAIWAFRRQQPAAGALALSGFGTLLMAATAAIYSTRELALPAELFRLLSSINHLGALGCCAGFVLVLCRYPDVITPRYLGRSLLAAFALIWLADVMQVLPYGNRMVTGSIIAGYVADSVLAAIQWRRTRGDPLRRAAMQWFLMSWLVGSGAFLLLVLIPAMAGFDSSRMQAYAFGLLMLVSLGLALGIARYRLFDLETWWFRAVGSVLGGFFVIGFDLIFVWLLHLEAPTALALSLAISGWIYFPTRQWLTTMLLRSIGVRQIRDVPTLLREVIADSPLEAEALLPESMRRLFEPLQMTPLDQSPEQIRIIDDGVALEVPGIGRWPGWTVRWPDNGHRLFRREDIQQADAVRLVLERLIAYQDAVEQGVEQERTRVAADLHDDVGARLLTLLHRSDSESALAIREVLSSLRMVVYALGAKPQPLNEALADWRSELHDRCEAAGARVEWIESMQLPDFSFDPQQQLNLARVLREAVSNALRHARPTRLRVSFDITGTVLILGVEHDGAATTPMYWTEGNGLRGMRSRARRLGAELRLRGESDRVSLTLSVPIRNAPPSKG